MKKVSHSIKQEDGRHRDNFTDVLTKTQPLECFIPFVGGSGNIDDAASTQEMVELGDGPKQEEETAPPIEDPTRTDVDTESGILVVP